MWRGVKNNWGFDAVVVRDDKGEIKGSVAVLNQKVPVIGTSLLYAPRGPVCDYHDMETLKELKAGVDELAKKYRAHEFKCDPDCPFTDKEVIENFKKLGFEHSYGPDGFEGIQPRFNYRIYLNGRTEEELFMNLSQPCRRKTRIAMKKGVEIKVVGRDMLPTFHHMMEVTGKRDNFNIRPLSYFEALYDSFGEYIRLYMGFYEGEPVCGALTTNFGKKLCYVYGASDNNHRDVMPNYLMQWEMIRWAVETNADIYDFQGVSGNLSPENNPKFGLYQFKNSFNGTMDEAPGEFNFIYNKGAEKFMEMGIKASGVLKNLKRRLRGG